MRTIVIGNMGEYSIRLLRYLEQHMPSDVHIVCCTDFSQLASRQEEEICLLGEAADMERADERYQKRILIEDKARAGSFCKFHSPSELLFMVEELFEEEKLSTPVGVRETMLTAVYMPSFEDRFREAALTFMEEGALCIGMENLGSASAADGDMGDLCYYVHLRSEDFVKKMMSMTVCEEDRYFIESPPVYFDLLDLSEEDFAWLFQTIRDENVANNVYVALGSGLVKNPEFFSLFDRIILMSSEENTRLQLFCSHFVQLLQAKGIRPRGGIEVIEKELFFR